MSTLQEKDFIQLLKGKRNGGYYQGNLFYVSQQTRPTKNEIFLDSGRIGLPNNIDETYEEEVKHPREKRKHLTVDPSFLQMLA